MDLPSIRAWALQTGSFFTEQDVRSAAKVAVLGSTVNSSCSATDADPVGQIIRIGKQPFKVIGVMASKGQGMGEDMDDQILVPYTTVQKKLLGHHLRQQHHRVGRHGGRHERGRRRHRGPAADAPRDRGRARATTS